VHGKGAFLSTADVRTAIEQGRGGVESMSVSRSADGSVQLVFDIRLEDPGHLEAILDAVVNVSGVVALRSTRPRAIKEIRKA
jgi:(p)ppGpp synthase/HD superfamily hydrolase